MFNVVGRPRMFNGWRGLNAWGWRCFGPARGGQLLFELQFKLHRQRDGRLGGRDTGGDDPERGVVLRASW